MTDEEAEDTDDSGTEPEPEPDPFPWGLFSVLAWGPAIREHTAPDQGVTVTRRVQAKVERGIRDGDDFVAALGHAASNTTDREDAVNHLLAGVDGVRLHAHTPDRREAVRDWTVEVDAPVNAWVDLAERESDGVMDELKTASKFARNDATGPGAVLAAMELTVRSEKGRQSDLPELLDHFERKTGLDDGSA